METKVCSQCKEAKSLGDFNRQKARKDGYQNYCRQCAKEKKRAWNQGNVEHLRQYEVERYQAIAPEKRLYRTEWYAVNKDKAKKTGAAWAQRNRDRCQGYARKRRAIELDALIDNVTVAGLRERDGDNCYLCLEPLQFDATRAVHIEHKTPLSRGGLHSYDNTALACQGCNQAKHNKTLEEYLSHLSAR